MVVGRMDWIEARMKVQDQLQWRRRRPSWPGLGGGHRAEEKLMEPSHRLKVEQIKPDRWLNVEKCKEKRRVKDDS